MPLHSNFSAFFKPGSIAVIGASQSPDKLGNIILTNLLNAGYQGKIFPVNPGAQEQGVDSILGLPVYRKLEAIPAGQRPLDLAVICLPAEKTPEAMLELAALPTKAVIIIGAGFKEVGSQGAALEREVRAIALENNMALLGPNCLGVVDTSSNLNVTFAKGGSQPGSIGFFSQSGAMCAAIFDWAREQNFGFSSFVSLGNKALTDESDMLAYLADDPATKVIVGYIESVEDGPRFLHNAQNATRKKPVILLKAGSTPEGARAASSHTGALAGSDMAYEAAFRQSGIIRARRTEDLFGMAQAFASQPLPKGNGVAIVTNAGGPSIVATDACSAAGLMLSRFLPETIEKLKNALPSYAALYNPVDVVSDAPIGRLAKAVAIVLQDPSAHIVLVLASATTHESVDALPDAIAALPNPDNKPIFACLMGGPAVASARRGFAGHGIPCYNFPEPAVDAMAAMYRQTRWKDNPLPVAVGYRHDVGRVRKTLDRALAENMHELAEFQAQEVLRAYEIPCLEAKLARTSDEAVQIAKNLGKPVALKIASPHILHKTDVRGVALNLETPDQVRSAFADITNRIRRQRPEAYITGCLVQAMAPKNSREVIIGFRRDERFGPMLVFGMGGIHVEAFRDIACRLAPLSLDDAHDMIREIKAFPLLAGMRGQKAIKFTALEDILLIMSQLALDFPEIQEAECNPVLVDHEAALVADIRLAFSPSVKKTNRV